MTSPEPSSEACPLGPGDSLGRYELLLPIAEGGMAVVWAARLKGSRGFSKTVAIKTMLPELSEDPHFQRMFLDEARIAARIRHPNVAEILDLGEEGGRLFLVLEWVDGEPLANLRRDAVKQGGMPLGVAVNVVRAACSGLHAAHELKDEHTGQSLGLVHRDISPQNVLLTFDGVVKIVDFGVAKAAGRSIEKTSAGHVKGKPPYMSPEQASGLDVDRRTDVFALGIILYQLVTGKHPFRGESDLVTLQNIVSERPVVPPRAHRRECPKQLELVILRAIERDPDQRYQSAIFLEQALEEALAELPRTRPEDITHFVQQVAGERGERRRRQIHEAIAVAEERSDETVARVESGPVRRISRSQDIDPHGRTQAADRATGSDDVTEVAAPAGVLVKRRAPWWWLVLVLVLVLGTLAISLGLDSERPEPPPSGIRHRATSLLPEESSERAPAPRVPTVSLHTTVTSASASAPSRSTRVPPTSSRSPSLKRPGKGPASATSAVAPAPSPRSGFAPPPVDDPGF